MQIPPHIQEQIAALDKDGNDPLKDLEAISAIREWLREAELNAIKSAREENRSWAQIGDAVGQERQRVHRNHQTASRIRG